MVKDRSGSVETKNRAVSVSITDEGRASECLDKVGNLVKGPRHKTMGQTSECDEVGIPRGVHPDGTDMGKDGDNS